MWLNSMQREEPYQGLTFRVIRGNTVILRDPEQVVHGCRQLVS
jgi:hypothetical protein